MLTTITIAKAKTRRVTKQLCATCFPTISKAADRKDGGLRYQLTHHPTPARLEAAWLFMV